MKYEITSRWSGAVLFSVEAGSLRLAVEAAVKTGADLFGADLGGANLFGANLARADLGGANLFGANLARADLGGVDLFGANLAGANLAGADLAGANLAGANLAGANLAGANLAGADLAGANLAGANLARADLARANLTLVRDDIWAVLSASPAEVEGLRAAIQDGRIDGSTYEGECACLVGTLARGRGCDYRAIPGLLPNSYRPAERFFAAIKLRDIPETSQFSRLALDWVNQWLANVRGAFAGKP